MRKTEEMTIDSIQIVQSAQNDRTQAIFSTRRWLKPAYRISITSARQRCSCPSRSDINHFTKSQTLETVT